MLDAAFIRDNLDAVKANCRNRNVDRRDVDRASSQFDDERKRLDQQTQSCSSGRTKCPKLIPKEKDATPKKQALHQGRPRPRRRKSAVIDDAGQAGRSRPAAATCADPEHDAPGRAGRDGRGRQQGHRAVRRAAEVRLQAEGPRRPGRGARPRGLRGRARRSPGRSSTSSRTRRCCWNWPSSSTRCRRCVKHGYTPVITPDLARVEVLEGIGFMPRDPNPETRQIYSSPTPTCA